MAGKIKKSFFPVAPPLFHKKIAIFCSGYRIAFIKNELQQGAFSVKAVPGGKRGGAGISPAEAGALESFRGVCHSSPCRVESGAA